MKFIHCADTHLGTQRFKDDYLAEDFVIAFQHMALDAVKRNVDAVIVSGDFFNKATVDPKTLLDAERVLMVLKEAGIEVLAVEGNHDIRQYIQEMSWLHFLSHEGLLKLLQIRYPHGRPELTPWNEESKKGTYIDLEGVRFYGMGYLGAFSSRKLTAFEGILDSCEFSVAMMHAGVDMFNDMEMGGVRKEDVELLKDKVNYVALGHVHKKYTIDDWMYNPGGLENWKPEECEKKKGYFVVDVHGEKATIDFVESVRRPGFVVEIDVAGYDNDIKLSAGILDHIDGLHVDPATAPIVSIKLKGVPAFDFMNLDLDVLREKVIDRTGAAECLINNKSSFSAIGPGSGPHTTREELEREVIKNLLNGRDIAGLSEERKIDLVLAYKNAALNPDVDKAGKPNIIRDLILEALAKNGVDQ